MKLKVKDYLNIYLLSELKSGAWNMSINNGSVLEYADISKAIPENRSSTKLGDMMITETSVKNLFSIRLLPSISTNSFDISFSAEKETPFVIEIASVLGDTISTFLVNNSDIKFTFNKSGDEYNVTATENGAAIDDVLRQQLLGKSNTDAFDEFVKWADDKKKRAINNKANLTASIASYEKDLAEKTRQRDKLNSDILERKNYSASVKKQLLDLRDGVKRSLYEFELKKQARKRLVEQLNESDDERDNDLLQYVNHIKMLKHACAYYSDEYSMEEKQYQDNTARVIKALMDGYKELSVIRVKYKQSQNNQGEEN